MVQGTGSRARGSPGATTKPPPQEQRASGWRNTCAGRERTKRLGGQRELERWAEARHRPAPPWPAPGLDAHIRVRGLAPAQCLRTWLPPVVGGESSRSSPFCCLVFSPGAAWEGQLPGAGMMASQRSICIRVHEGSGRPGRVGPGPKRLLSRPGCPRRSETPGVRPSRRGGSSENRQVSLAWIHVAALYCLLFPHVLFSFLLAKKTCLKVY